MIKKPKILFYDLETSPLLAYIWRCGEQFVGHSQLQKDHSQYGIICASYCWNDGEPAKTINWGYNEQSTAKVVEQFDKIIKQADMAIGKNSDRFDVKMLNAARMFSGLPGMPEWSKYTDDLEKQMRKHFKLPSQSLDYISAQLGYGGKTKMEMQDWIDIVERNKNGRAKLKKMCGYCEKDVEDTRTIWNHCEEHFTPRFNMGTYLQKVDVCIRCGSDRINKSGIRALGGTLWQEYRCGDCGKVAGRCAANARVRRLK